LRQKKRKVARARCRAVTLQNDLASALSDPRASLRLFNK
jgi:hypothetical protein